MTAREMFKKLGFEQTLNDSDFIFYEKVEAESCHTRFMFALESRSFEAIFYVDGYGGGCHFIELDEFKVILKQMEELGWIEEEKNEIKQETNFEHYKDRILDCCIDNLAVVKGIPKSCSKIDCNDCDFLTIQKECCEIAKDWLKQPYKKLTYKLNKFEIDLLQSCSQGYSPKYQFKNINSLTEMRKNGYFKCINRDETIEEILAKCEVTK